MTNTEKVRIGAERPADGMVGDVWSGKDFGEN